MIISVVFFGFKLKTREKKYPFLFNCNSNLFNQAIRSNPVIDSIGIPFKLILPGLILIFIVNINSIIIGNIEMN